MESQRITAGDLGVHYLHAGSGSPVILLHGFPETSYEWRHVIPELSEHHEVFAPDTRGHGATDKPESGYDRAALAADVIELVDGLGLDRVALVGHDWGGIIAAKVAFEYPQRLSCLALLDTICTGWPAVTDYFYWFVAPGLAEDFFPRYHRAFIEALLTGHSEPAMPAAPLSPWHFPAELVAPHQWATKIDIDTYADAIADPAVTAADLAYYRSLQFHRVIHDSAAPNGERYQPVSHKEMAAAWHGGQAGGEYLDYAPDDRHRTFNGPTLWMRGRATAAVLDDPAFAAFTRHFTHLTTVDVDAGHFFVEEAPEFTADTLMEFLSQQGGAL